MLKNLRTMWETWVRFLGWEDLLENGKATHSSILAWRIPWAEEPGGLQSWGCKESDMTESLTLLLFKYKWHLHGSQQLIKDFHIISFGSSQDPLCGVYFQFIGKDTEVHLEWK